MSMYPRTNYEMTQEDLDRILDACKPVPYIVIGGHAPRSAQENANAAWAELGARMGFDAMTVQPDGRSNRTFTAIPSETVEQRCERILREKNEADAKERERLKKVIADAQAALEKLLPDECRMGQNMRAL